MCSGFLRPEKIHRPKSGLNPCTLDLKASTLPQDHRGRQTQTYIGIIIYVELVDFPTADGHIRQAQTQK